MQLRSISCKFVVDDQVAVFNALNMRSSCSESAEIPDVNFNMMNKYMQVLAIKPLRKWFS